MLRFWFYDALQARRDGKKPSLTDRIIMMRSPLTHAEVEFVERRMWFSSTLAEGANGCRMMRHRIEHPNRWQTVDVPLNRQQLQRAWEKACCMSGLPSTWMEQLGGHVAEKKVYQDWSHKHVPYDKLGLMSFALKRSDRWWLDMLRGLVWGWTLVVKPSEEGVWCSEACAMVLKAGLWGDEPLCAFPLEVSPSDLKFIAQRAAAWIERGLV